MSYEDKTLVCVQCKKEFVFTAGEQEFFAERNFTSEPKRCKGCRRSRKRGKDSVTGYGEYRSPAFERSAPDHQQIRGRKRGGRRRRRGGPAPGGTPQPRTDQGGGGAQRGQGGRGRGRGGARRGRGNRGYRSPAFRNKNAGAEQDYRAPGFKVGQQINPDEEYRAPGFKEFEHINPDEEYRSPGFHDGKDQYVDEQPMFALLCPVCGEEKMVPFLPEEKENPMCGDCYKATKAAEAAEAEAKAKAEAAEEAAPAEEAQGGDLSASASADAEATGGASTSNDD